MTCRTRQAANSTDRIQNLFQLLEHREDAIVEHAEEKNDTKTTLLSAFEDCSRHALFFFSFLLFLISKYSLTLLNHQFYNLT